MPRARGRQIPCGGNANIMLPGFSMTTGIMEVMTITVAYSTRENSMKFTNHATKCCDGISLSDAFEFTMLWSALPQIICALLRVMGTFLNLRSRMSPLNMKDINALCSGSSALERLKARVETGAGMILKMKYWK